MNKFSSLSNKFESQNYKNLLPKLINCFCSFFARITIIEKKNDLSSTKKSFSLQFSVENNYSWKNDNLVYHSPWEKKKKRDNSIFQRIKIITLFNNNFFFFFILTTFSMRIFYFSICNKQKEKKKIKQSCYNNFQRKKLINCLAFDLIKRQTIIVIIITLKIFSLQWFTKFLLVIISTIDSMKNSQKIINIFFLFFFVLFSLHYFCSLLLLISVFLIFFFSII